MRTLGTRPPLPTVSTATLQGYYGSLAHSHGTRGMVTLEPDLPVEEQKPAILSDGMAWTFSWRGGMQTNNLDHSAQDARLA